MQEQYKKSITFISYVVVTTIFILCFWYVSIERSMVVRRDPLTNTFIFIHIALVFLLLSVGAFCCYMYIQTKQPYDIINGSIYFILSNISIYFSIKNLNNTDLIIYPNTGNFIQEIRYLHTIDTFDGVLLLIMIVITITLLFYHINYSYTHKYIS